MHRTGAHTEPRGQFIDGEVVYCPGLADLGVSALAFFSLHPSRVVVPAPGERAAEARRVKIASRVPVHGRLREMVNSGNIASHDVTHSF